METLLIIGGALLLLGGLSQSWMTLGLYRRGRQWRGSAIISGAFVLWGVAVLAGLQSNGSPLGAVLVCLVAIVVLGGLWQRRREQSRPS